MSFISSVLDTLKDTDVNIAIENLQTPISSDDKPKEQGSPTQPTIPPSFSNILFYNPSTYCVRIAPNIYKVGIVGAIMDFEPYRKLREFLIDDVDENSIVYIDINSPGGVVSIGFQIIDAMEMSPALKITNIMHYAYSMGAMIWSHGELLSMSPISTIMYHNIITSVSDNIHKVRDYVNIQSKISQSMFDKFIDRGLLTEDELKMITEDNQDLYLPYEDMKDRIVKANIPNMNRYESLIKGA